MSLSKAQNMKCENLDAEGKMLDGNSRIMIGNEVTIERISLTEPEDAKLTHNHAVSPMRRFLTERPRKTKESEQQFQERLLESERIKWPGLYENPMPHGWKLLRGK
ncbi:hypothetical protein TWF730_006406 [Orbilia blumenaviensis]|uniref:Uncharacterized protein n=1 Tax=Orbilia blumenaviensis TaxID=1796055 RepID=A0AAV9VGN6_9PEZI